jgi:hypothetical protein
MEFMCISNLLGILIANTTYFVCSVIPATVYKYAPQLLRNYVN